MLQSLYIKNIAIFEELGVSFENGFCALTGETGAGKSILIDAVNLLLGGKAFRDLVRSGENSAMVSAIFYISDGDIIERLQRESIEIENGELYVSREILKDGRNVCKIGARPVTVAMLKEIGLLLINIHGQSDNLSLYRREVHIHYLDQYCGDFPAREKYRDCYARYRLLTEKIGQYEAAAQDAQERLDRLSYIAEELRNASLQAGEEEKLREKKQYYTNRERILSAVYAAYQALLGGQEASGAYDLLKLAEREIDQISAYDEAIGAIYERLSELAVLVQDVAQDTRALSDGNDFSPAEMERLQERLDLISRLRRKYNKDEAELIEYQTQVEEELFALQHGDIELAKLKKERDSVRVELSSLAEEISDKRRAMAARLEQSVRAELSELDMPSVKFQVQIMREAQESGGYRFREDGIDVVEFLIAPNAGEGLKPISKIASGGEMARIMLAIKSVLCAAETVDTLIFDEIDTGVSGRAAQKIAQKMFMLSRQKQVMAVTHLPQIASMANAHYLIEKREENGRTQAGIERLEDLRRAQEIARMTGGVEITALTLDNAREMLRQAWTYQQEVGKGVSL